MPEPIRFGIVGYTSDVFKRYFYPAFLEVAKEENIVLVAVASRKDKNQNIQAMKSRCNNPYIEAKEKKSLENLLPEIENGNVIHYQLNNGLLPDNFFKDINAFYVATTSDSHKQLVLQGINKGVHVLCEKPLSFRANDLSDIVHAAHINQNGKICMDVEHYSYKGPSKLLFENIREIVGREKLGKIISVKGYIKQKWSEDTENGQPRDRFEDLFNKRKSGGGVGIDTLIHLISILHGIDGKINKIYSAIGYNRFPERYDIETAICVYAEVTGPLFNPNAKAYFETAKFVDDDKARKSFQIDFENGAIYLNFDNGCFSYVRWNPEPHMETMQGNSNAHVNMLRHFLECIKTGKKPLTTFEPAQKNLEKIFEIYRSYLQMKDWHDYY